MPTTCAICDSDRCEPLLNRQNKPLLLNAVYDDRESARKAPVGDLDFWRCAACGFVWNAAFITDRLIYGPDYENRQSLSPAFQIHLKARAEACLALIEPNRPATIVEVGCGQGDFLRVLSASPGVWKGITFWGFDPAWRGDGRGGPDGCRISGTHFDETTDLDGCQADLVISRHVIEHIQDPVAFLRELRRRVTPGSRLTLETPDVDWILRTSSYHDLFYEHCSLFTLESLDRALTKSGFISTRIERVFDEQYLWVEASPVSGTFPGVNLGSYHRRWDAAIAEALAKGPVMVWGAGAKGASFAHWFDPGGERIAAVIDVNPAKQNRYLGGGGHKIISPDRAVDFQPKTIFVMNPAYEEEVISYLRENNWSTDVVVVR